MLQKLKDLVFWKQQFDSCYRTAQKAHPIISQDEIEKQRFYWREKKGKTLKQSPRLAAYNAFRELADHWRLSTSRQTDKLLFIAHLIQEICPYIDEQGNYQNPEEFLTEPWKTFARRYWRNWHANERAKKDFADSLSSIKFSVTEVESAWQEIKAGNIPEIASSIWRSSHPRKTAKEILDETGATKEEFVLWMLVFRENMYFVESVVVGEQMYYRQQKEPDLAAAINMFQ